jgi:hypothetical protein
MQLSQILLLRSPKAFDGYFVSVPQVISGLYKLRKVLTIKEHANCIYFSAKIPLHSPPPPPPTHQVTQGLRKKKLGRKAPIKLINCDLDTFLLYKAVNTCCQCYAYIFK